MATPALQPPAPVPPARYRGGEVILVSVICLILPVVAGIYLSPRSGWLVIAVLMVVYFLFLGRWISGRPLGIVISERNLMSLSRFQMVSWTVLLLSAFLELALRRLHVLSSHPLALPITISMHWRVCALVVNNATSPVGWSPLFGSVKHD